MQVKMGLCILKNCNIQRIRKRTKNNAVSPRSSACCSSIGAAMTIQISPKK
jgi:hypothetical protein